MSRGEKRSTNVANDHERFSGKFERPVVEAAIGKFSEYVPAPRKDDSATSISGQ
jgi:hypothetical protein